MSKRITIDDLARMVQKGFDAVDKRFDAVDTRLDGLTLDVSYLKTKVDEIEQRLNRHEEILEEHTEELLWLRKHLEELAESKQDKQVYKEIEDLRARLARVEKKIGIAK